MQIEITDSAGFNPTFRDRFYTTSEVVWHDKERNVLMIDRPPEQGGPMEFGSVSIQKILDKEIILKGYLPAPSGMGKAPAERFIRITFL
jgi:hypothetical protein